MKSLNPLAKPTKLDLNSEGYNIQSMIVSSLEKKYPGHDFAVFGKSLYVDDKDIMFPYSDANMQEADRILESINQEVAKLL